MRGFARTAVLLALTLLVSPAGLLACAWECAPEAPAQSEHAAPAASPASSCHDPASAVTGSDTALRTDGHGCDTHAVAVADEAVPALARATVAPSAVTVVDAGRPVELTGTALAAAGRGSPPDVAVRGPLALRI